MDVNFFGSSFTDLFGFTLPKGKKAPFNPEPKSINLFSNLTKAIPFQNKSFVAPDPHDGALVYQYGGGSSASYTSFDALFQTQNQLIIQYRMMSLYPECDSAIDDIINAMLIVEENKPIVTVALKNLKVSETLKNKIREEFDYILKLLKFRHNYYRLARLWYVDGRLFHHIMIDKDNPRKGITELRYIDPRRIRKIRGVEQVIDPRTRIPIVVDAKEFYLYNYLGILSPSSLEGIPISPDAISFANSGELNPESTQIISFLHKAIKPMNQLKMMEDAVVIYRVTRAPDRLVFYIDVSNLPTNKAEAHVKDLMNRFKSRLVYNASTGEVGDDRRYMAMQEDYWMPQRDGKGTKVDRLPAGEITGKMDDVDYYLRQLYKSLNVPISRLDPNTGFNLGRQAEISRDERKFNIFINRLRGKFGAGLFSSLLKPQLILKNIATEESWNDIVEYISYDYQKDSYYAEIEESEILLSRLERAEASDQFLGKYYSHKEVKMNHLRQTEEDIARIQSEIDQETKEGLFAERDGFLMSTLGPPVTAGAKGSGSAIPPTGEESETVDAGYGNSGNSGTQKPKSPKYNVNQVPANKQKKRIASGNLKLVS